MRNPFRRAPRRPMYDLAEHEATVAGRDDTIERLETENGRLGQQLGDCEEALAMSERAEAEMVTAILAAGPYDGDAVGINALAAVAEGRAAHIEQLRAKLDRHSDELRDKGNDLLHIRGLLSPNGRARQVPFELGAEVAPAIEWLINETAKLRANFADINQALTGHIWTLPGGAEGVQSLVDAYRDHVDLLATAERLRDEAHAENKKLCTQNDRLVSKRDQAEYRARGSEQETVRLRADLERALADLKHSLDGNEKWAKLNREADDRTEAVRAYAQHILDTSGNGAQTKIAREVIATLDTPATT